MALAGDAQFSLFGGFVPTIGDKLVIIVNDGSDPVTGTLSNANESQQITIDGVTFAVNYADNFGGAMSS